MAQPLFALKPHLKDPLPPSRICGMFRVLHLPLLTGHTEANDWPTCGVCSWRAALK